MNFNKLLKEKLKKAMEENRRTDEIALKSLGFKNLDEFIKAKAI